MALVSIDDFAAYLKRDPADLDAGAAALMLDGASAAVVEYCGWHIAPVVSETLGVDGTGTRIQTLPTLNLLSVDAVAENGLSLNPAMIDWSANGILEKRSGREWTARRRGVVVDITHGYEITPRWVQTLICAVAGRAMMTPLGIAQETAGGESITYTVPRTATTGMTPPGTVGMVAAELRMLDRIALPKAA